MITPIESGDALDRSVSQALGENINVDEIENLGLK
jgi:hypothetical protein